MTVQSGSSMTLTPELTGSTPDDVMRTARITGVFYLVFFVVGVLGTLVVPDQIFVSDDSQTTLSNLLQDESLARLLVALELALVLAQALTALWFFKLFRSVDTFAAGSVAVFGMVNATVMMISAAVLATTLEVANDPTVVVAGGAAATVQLLFVLSGNLWGVGGLFFGLWLIPMGYLVVRSGWLPRALGWILMVGGVAYLLSAFVEYLLPDGESFVGLLTVPATIGELWIMGYLVIVGVRRGAGSTVRRVGGSELQEVL